MHGDSRPDDQTSLDIDWSAFDAIDTSWCDCRCGFSFESHAKAIYDGPHRGIHTRGPCPACGRTDSCTAIRGKPETYTIAGGS